MCATVRSFCRNNTSLFSLPRPFGIAALIAGVNADGEPQLFKTDPSGNYQSWKAAATGRNSKSVQEFLEKHYDGAVDETNAIKLALKALQQVVEGGAKNVEIAVLRPEMPVELLDDNAVEKLCVEIEAEADDDE